MNEWIETAVPDFRMRWAVRDDAGLILTFIRELAEYERLSHEVSADVALLEETLFGERPAAEVLLGYRDDAPVSFALFFHNYSTFLGRPGIYLEDLFVRPDVRGRGIGRAMLVELARIAKARGCGRLEWAVLDWNESAIGFYNSLGAEPQDAWSVFRLTGKSLDDLAR